MLDIRLIRHIFTTKFTTSPDITKYFRNYFHYKLLTYNVLRFFFAHKSQVAGKDKPLNYQVLHLFLGGLHYITLAHKKYLDFRLENKNKL